MQSAGDFLHNVHDTNYTIMIDFSLMKSVQYYVQTELLGIRAYLLDDVEVIDANKIWFKKALDQRNAGQWTFKFSGFIASADNSWRKMAQS